MNATKSARRHQAMSIAAFLFASAGSGFSETYPGLYDGPWVEAAEKRIEQIRKADIQVRVTKEGAPVSDVHVDVEMRRHAFPFGSAVVAKRLVEDDSSDGQRYREAVTSLFNRVVFENDLKWQAWKGEWEPGHVRDSTFKAIDWLKDNDMELRGHCLVWPGWKNLPPSLKEYENDPAALAKQVHDHIVDVAGAMKGHVVEWDVVNETWWNHDLQDILGKEVMIDWFKTARKTDPNAKLFINDARIVAFGGQELDHKEHYYNEVDYLVSNGAPIDGIGFQCHFYEHALTHPEDALAMFDRFHAFGLDMAITEYDFKTDNEEMQARYLYDFMHVMFSHPGVTQFIMWGFWEGQIFRAPCAMYRKDWSPKPSGKMFRDLVFEKWWTRENGQTGSDGLYNSRGFLGDYTIRVDANGFNETFPVSVTRDGLSLEVEVTNEGIKIAEGKTI